MNKSYRIWEKTKQWCIENPGKKAMVSMIDGDFVITWTPKTEKLKLKGTSGKTKAILTFLMMLTCAATAQAEPLRLVPYVVLGVGQAADVWSTRVAVSRGCTEGNGAYRSQAPTTARLVGTKLLLVGPVALTAALLDRHGHHRAAAVIATGGGVVGGVIATWNLSIQCGR